MKILIVDDEPRHRRGMKNLIGSLRPADQVIDAGDGQAALALIRDAQPDVVLTDIRMPNMDGLAFLRLLEDESVKPKVVMISAYDRFDYAQTAIRHGAYDYLLKPVDADKVEQLLRRLEASLQEEALQQTESEAVKLQLREAKTAYRRRLLLSWLNGSLDEPERQELAKLEWLRGRGIVLITELYTGGGSAYRKEVAASLSGELAQLLAPYGPLCILCPDVQPDASLELVTIVQTELPFPEGQEQLCQALQALNGQWQEDRGLRHSIGVASTSLWEQGTYAYRKAREISAYHFYEKGGCALVEQKAPRLTQGAAVDSEALLQALQHKDPAAAVQLNIRVFEDLAADGKRPPTELREHASVLLMKIKSRNHVAVDQQIDHQLAHAAVAEVPACRTFSELMDVLKTQLLLLHQSMHAGRGERDIELAAECVKWIGNHYQEPITLETAAERFFFNPSYFSTWIKQHTGKTFTEHLLEARMAHAVLLLTQSRLRIYEVAAACGYTDTKYFCRVFKKRFGLSPEGHRHAVLMSGREGSP
ncbi:response regulator [Paenibacillus daejeonensis]|uniref:response regulator n=1 Tax=Paenibacillus daejeonensis TaxID=135193 RepID=UPI00035D5124|nr:response regulator [Paenibacillus daejeonensis]